MARLRPRDSKPRLEAHYDETAGTVTLVPEDAEGMQFKTTWLTSDTTIDLTEAR